MDFGAAFAKLGWASSDLPNAPAECELPSYLKVQSRAKIKPLRPYRPSEAPANSISSTIGLGAQPPHSDCATWPAPPRFIFLKDRTEGNCSVQTRLFTLDAKRIVRDRPSILLSEVWTYQTPGFRGLYGSILQAHNRFDYRVRFDPTVMRSPRALSIDALNTIVSYTDECQLALSDIDWLIIDNWRCLHGRSKVNESELNRVIFREYWS